MVCKPEGAQDEAISPGPLLLWLALYDGESLCVEIGGHGSAGGCWNPTTIGGIK